MGDGGVLRTPMGRRTIGFGNSVYEVSVLALEFEQEGLELAERAAFNSGCRFRGKPRDS
jgi:hypothetical protein